jgi:hypothetical protein
MHRSRHRFVILSSSLGLALFGCGDPSTSDSTGDQGESAHESESASTGDGDGDGDGDSNAIVRLELAQTHVLPSGLRIWQLGDTAHELHVVGGRSFLALVELAQPPSSPPMLEAWAAGQLLGSVPLDPPSALPPTEAQGSAYGEMLHSAEVDAAWVVPGLEIRIVDADGLPIGEPTPLPVGADTEFDMWTLPFYLFGANDDNSAPIAQTGMPGPDAQAELYAKWPIARVNFVQHPATRVDWPYIIVGPRDGAPAMRVEAKDQQLDGFAVMSAVLNTLSALRDANGESGTNNQYYAPLLMLTSGGIYEHPGGGLGGGHLGTGDYDYSGIFIHEQGHAFGMPHAADAYASGSYPYVGGSLLGSVWGYDVGRREFLATFVPTGADTANSCTSDAQHQLDDLGRCVKQDPMQSGAGDQAPGYRYTMFSDFNASVIQRYFEGRTTLDENDIHQYEGGRIFVDSNSSSGYSRWDTIDQSWVEVAVETIDNGLYGFDRGLPSERDVPVHAIVFSISGAGDPGITQIYPPLSFMGNLRREVDPTSDQDLAAIVPNVSENPWYCHAAGCDYTLRVTYESGNVLNVLVRGGFRPWFAPTDPPEPSSSDSVDGNSYRVFGINVPGGEPLTKIELLDTPLGFEGLPPDPAVLAVFE